MDEDINKLQQKEELEVMTYDEVGKLNEDDDIPESEKNTLDAPVVFRYQSPVSDKEYEIRQFNHNQIGENFTVVLYARRRTGKTYALHSLMLARRHLFPRVYVFSKTRGDHEYHPYVPEHCIIEGLQEEVFWALVDEQRELVEQMHQSGENDHNIKLMIVIDDCLADGYRWRRDLDTAFFNGRHLQIELYITTQDMMGLPPALVTNTDLAICGRMTDDRSIEALRKKFGTFFKNNDDLLHTMAALFEGRRHFFMMFNCACPFISPDQLWFCGRFHRPDETTYPIVMGCKEFWEGAEQQLMKHPGGMEFLSAPDEVWGVVTDHTPDFKPAKY